MNKPINFTIYANRKEKIFDPYIEDQIPSSETSQEVYDPPKTGFKKDLTPSLLVKSIKSIQTTDPHLSFRKVLQKTFSSLKSDFVESERELQEDGIRSFINSHRASRTPSDLEKTLQQYAGPTRIRRPFSLTNTETGEQIEGEAITNLPLKNIQMTPVSSSNVAGAGVDVNELIIQFHGRGPNIFKYNFGSFEEASEAYKSILSSGSPGRWVWKNIRGHEAGEEVTEAKLGPALLSGKPTIGGTSKSLVNYSLTNKIPIERVGNYNEATSKLRRLTANPLQDPNKLNSQIERELQERRNLRGLGIQHKKSFEHFYPYFQKEDPRRIDMIKVDSMDKLISWVETNINDKGDKTPEEIAFAIANSRKKKNIKKEKKNKKEKKKTPEKQPELWKKKWNEIGSTFDKQRKLRELNKKIREYDLQLQKESQKEIKDQDYDTLRSLRDNIEKLKYDRLKGYPQEAEVKFRRYTPELIESIKNAVGKEGSIKDNKDLSYGDKLATVEGYDKTYGLSRDWLGGWKPSREDKEHDLKTICIGSLVEYRGKKGPKIYKKIDNNKYILVAEETNTGDYGRDRYSIYNVPTTQDLNKMGKQELEIIATEHRNEATRIAALQKLDDIETLKMIALSDNSHEVSSKAYHRIKAIAPESPILGELRSYYERSSKAQSLTKKIAMVKNLYGTKDPHVNKQIRKLEEERARILSSDFIDNNWVVYNVVKDTGTFETRDMNFSGRLYPIKLKRVVYTTDFIPLSNFKRCVHDFREDFTLLHGAIARSGGYPYYHKGKKVVYRKDWDNLKDIYAKYDYLPLRAQKEKGSHHAAEVGLAYNFKPNEETEEIEADLLLLDNIEDLTDILEPKEGGYYVSPGYHDIIEGNTQIIIDLDHVALSLSNEDTARACLGKNEKGASCTMVNIIENYDQNQTDEVVN